MLVKFFPHQVAEHWEVLKVGIEESLPPTVGESRDKMNNILESILIGDLTCWVSYNSGNIVNGMMVTRILYDSSSKTRSLLIYCLYTYDKTDADSWISGMDTLRKYAIAQNCSRITGYSNVDSIIKIVEKFGGDSSYRFLSIPLS